jgi:hypothetical protein
VKCGFGIFDFFHPASLATVERLLLAYRGRDAHFCAPPAQIPAAVIHPPGSHLECLTTKRTLGQG